MRFLAPENFDTPNNKQGHEAGHQRRIERGKKCLEASMVFSSPLVSPLVSLGFGIGESLKCPSCARRPRSAGNWTMLGRQSRSQARSTRISFPSSALVSSCFRGFSIPFARRSQLTRKTCRHSSDFFSRSCFSLRRSDGSQGAVAELIRTHGEGIHQSSRVFERLGIFLRVNIEK